MARWGTAITEPDPEADDLLPVPRFIDGFAHLHPIAYQPPSGQAILRDYVDGYRKMREHHSAPVCVLCYHGVGVIGLFLAWIFGALRDSCIRPGRVCGLLVTILIIIIGLLIAL